MKQPDRATAASLRYRKKEAAISGNVSRNSKIRQTPQSSQEASSPGKHKFQRLYVLRTSKITKEKLSNLHDASS